MTTLTPPPPTTDAPSAAEPPPAPPSAPRIGLARPRAPEILAIALVAGLVAGCVTGAIAAAPRPTADAMAAWMPDFDRGQNDALAYSLGEMRLALEEYGTDHNGTYPPQAGWAAELGKHGFVGLPNNRLPVNPWGPGKAPIATEIDGWPPVLAKVQDVADGKATLAPRGTDLGPGRMPGEPGPAGAIVYGTIFYAYAPDNQVYVLYAVGKRGNRAIVVACTSNGSC